jgi:hypothetical protein
MSLAKEAEIEEKKTSWKTRVQGHISNWGKELSILSETGTSSNSGKLNRKKREILKNIE